MPEPEDMAPERIFRQVLASFCRIGSQTEIDYGVSMKELGIDSIDLVKLVVALEDEYDVLLPPELLPPEAFATPGSLWETIRPALSIEQRQ